MTAKNIAWQQPAQLVLATDLSARCDRALDRAVLLARAWQAELTLVHALEGGAGCDSADDACGAAPDAVAALRARVQRELAEQGWGQLDVVCREGAPDQVVLDHVRATGAGLVVTGVARDQPFRQAIVGDTALALARASACDVLTVRKHGRLPYRRIIVATDMSAGSAAALHAARALFPAAQLGVFHACAAPFAGMVGDREDYVANACAAAMAEARQFLADTLGPQEGAAVTLDVAEGKPVSALARYAAEQDADLIVAGVKGCGALADVLLGSVASGLLQSAPCDVLLVRPR